MICVSKHKDGPEILAEYFSRTLDAARAAEFERHAAGCAECRGLIAAWNTLDQWEAPAVSADFDARLYARIAAQAPAPWWQRMFAASQGWWRPAIPVAAGCAVVVLALAIRLPQAPVPAPPDDKAKVEMVNMDQLERELEDLDLLAPLGPAAEL
jgi:anti-sigma-K factor RskA